MVWHTPQMDAQLEQVAYHYPDAKVVGYVANNPIIRLDKWRDVRLFYDGTLGIVRSEVAYAVD